MLDDAAILQTERRSGLPDPATVVRHNQEELVRTAYLLTGDASRAQQLAEDAVQQQLRPLLRGYDRVDWRLDLLQTLGALYLAAPLPGAEPGASPLVGAPTRFNVDDERTRMWAALARCETTQRLALVFRDFNQLDEESVADLIHRVSAEMRGWLNAGRIALLRQGTPRENGCVKPAARDRINPRKPYSLHSRSARHASISGARWKNRRAASWNRNDGASG